MRMHRDLKALLSRAGVRQQRKLAEECTELVSFSCLSASSEQSASSRKLSLALPQPGCAGCGGGTPAPSGDSRGDHSQPASSSALSTCSPLPPDHYGQEVQNLPGRALLRKTNARAREMNLRYYL